MNRAIELHDSKIRGMTRDGADLVLDFSHAYTHESVGRPGIDPGVGLSQQIRLRVREAEADRLPPHWPVTIADGALQVAQQLYDNCLPIELDSHDDTTLSLTVYDGESTFTSFVIRGNGAVLDTYGPTTMIDTFPGDSDAPPN